MAVSVKKAARVGRASALMCFSSYKGMLLQPELLLALKWDYRVDSSSSAVINYSCGLLRGGLVVAGVAGSQYSALLKAANYAGSGACALPAEGFFSIPQNYLGLYLSMPGSS